MSQIVDRFRTPGMVEGAPDKGHGSVDHRIDRIFEQVDDLLCAAQFDACDQLLERVDPLRHRIRDALGRVKGPSYADRLLAKIS